MKLRLSSLLTVMLLSLGLVVLVSPAPPAWACSCVSFDEQDERAELIVVGTVTDVSDSGIRMTVESVEKGAAAADNLRLKVGRGEASCGYDFRAGGRYRVNSVDGATGLCTGVSPLPAAVSVPPAAAPVAAPVAESSAWGWWLAAGAGVAVLAAGLVIARRRG
ncbi:hypothetical protein ACQP2Y_25685 [Actinoplanes sp. CA-051413]|uniref:hypothetical protein n=1 Tax=Actinoplanes sp. CA-051413 TaxID=3239899 RepID=UPI003D983D82